LYLFLSLPTLSRETTKYSDKGKGQATSQQKAPDVVRVAQDTEQQRLQNKPEVRQRRTSSRESTSGLKKIERRLEELHVSKPRERNLEGQQQKGTVTRPILVRHNATQLSNIGGSCNAVLARLIWVTQAR
jgi:hypothetical protein